ncbi:MAG: Ig-like domain-containing protein, partial [Planctomycetales bacterium]
TLIGQAYYGGVGDEHGTGIAVVGSGTNYEVYAAGMSNALNSEGLVIKFGMPGTAGNVAPMWSKSWPGVGGNDQFFGLEATTTDVFVAGSSYARTTDTVGDKEGKGITVDFPADGGNSRWERQTPAAPGAFTYGGWETLYDSAVAVEGGETYIYVSGQAQSGFSNGGRLFLSKLNAAGNVLWTRTDPAGNPGSDGRRVVAQGGYIYVAGSTSDSGTQKAYIKKYDPSGALVWAKTSAAGAFHGLTVDAANGSLYAVGQTSGTNADFLAEKWDLAGNIVWSKSYDRVAATDILNGVALLDGRLYTAGSTRGGSAGGSDGVILELDPATGTLAQTTLWGGPEDDSFADMSVTDGRLHVVGTTRSYGSGGSDLVYLVYGTSSTDTTPPTVDILDVTPDPRATSVSSIGVNFSEPVSGFDLADLALTRNGVAVPLSSATLTTSDNIGWTLGNLEALTGASGSYVLALNASESNITDRAGNLLAADASDAWSVEIPCAAGAFYDGFEAQQLDPFWTRTETSGSITVPSTVLPHTGNQALQFNSTNTGSDKWIHVDHTFGVPTYGTFSVWVYDTGADISSSNYLQLALTGVNDRASIGTNDYDLGPGQNGATYHFSTDLNSWTASDIDRTAAWHKFEIRTSPSAVTYVIDGITVHTESSGLAVESVSLYMFGPSWRPAWESYFDDFSFTPSRSVLIDFDALDTRSNPQSGSVLASYLAACGVSITNVTPGTEIFVRDARSMYPDIQPIVPSSPFNVLTHDGMHGPVSYTLVSNGPLDSVHFTRPYIRAGQTGVALPEWSAHALDALGNEISSVGEPAHSIFVDASAVTFTLAGPNIAAIRFDSNNYHFAAFGSVILDDLVLEKEANPPTANAADDNVLVENDGRVRVVQVLGNDTAASEQGYPLTITQIGATDAGGSVRIEPGRQWLLYRPADGFVGTEHFTYT